MILDGDPWRGRGGAGEIGHMVVEIGGARCTCGRRGCMEAYAGRSAMEEHVRKLVKKGEKTDLLKLMEQHDRTRLTSGIWSRALEKGDELAQQMIDAGHQGARGWCRLGGEPAGRRGGDPRRWAWRAGSAQPAADRVAEAMQPHLFADSRPPHVEVAALGDFGGAIGASLLVNPPSGRRCRSGGLDFAERHEHEDHRERRQDDDRQPRGCVQGAAAAALAHHPLPSATGAR